MTEKQAENVNEIPSSSAAVASPQVVAKKSNVRGYVFGGLAGMGATCIVQPLDLVKTRLQVSTQYRNAFHCLSEVVKKEGLFKVYTGLSAALLRQATYTTTRLGVYSNLNELAKQKNIEPNLLIRMLLGITAGACGAFVGTPAEIALIRMTADGRLPLDQRRNYKNVVNALARISKEEGILALWRGCIPTMGRAMVVNMVQLASYSQAKDYYRKQFNMPDNILLHLSASMTSGFLTTTASMPVDMAKTRIQNMKISDGKPEYSGTMDVLLKVVRKEGVLTLWKGFTPYLFRLGPHTVLTFIFLEQLNKFYSQYVLGQSDYSSGL